MRKLTFTILLFALTLPAFCPAGRTATIFATEKIAPYSPMVRAFEFVESSFDCDTVNRLGYGGILQIGQEMIDEANRVCKITGNPARFTLVDRLDSTKSVSVWYIVMDYWNAGYDLQGACKIWNPLASKKYYQKIKKYLQD